MFSGVEHFALLDFWSQGVVDENVFAFGNRSIDGLSSTLVLYNNAYQSTGGWVRESTAINEGEADDPRLVRRTLAEVLGLKGEQDIVYGFWELRRRQWLLRTGAELVKQGLFANLSGYEALVFMDVREVAGESRLLAHLVEQLGGGWCDDYEAALDALRVSSDTAPAGSTVLATDAPAGREEETSVALSAKKPSTKPDGDSQGS